MRESRFCGQCCYSIGYFFTIVCGRGLNLGSKSENNLRICKEHVVQRSTYSFLEKLEHCSHDFAYTNRFTRIKMEKRAKSHLFFKMTCLVFQLLNKTSIIQINIFTTDTEGSVLLPLGGADSSSITTTRKTKSRRGPFAWKSRTHTVQISSHIKYTQCNLCGRASSARCSVTLRLFFFKCKMVISRLT